MKKMKKEAERLRQYSGFIDMECRNVAINHFQGYRQVAMK